MLHRRTFVVSAGAFGLCAGRGNAQTASPLRRVGVLFNGNPGSLPTFEIYKDGFARLGYEEGRTLAFEARYARGQLERLPALAAEFVQSGVDLFLTAGGPASKAARNATATIPIVFSIVTDPVALGLVASMQRPDGNATGITSLDPEQADRQVALLRRVLPKLSRLGILSDDTIPGADASGLAPIDHANAAAARKLGIEPIVRKVAGGVAPDYAGQIDDMLKNGAEAMLVLEVPMPLRDGKIVAEAANARRLPTLFPGGQSGAGGLIAFGTSVFETWHRMPIIADKILKGNQPGQIPVETWSRREFVVNLKTAQAIGVTIPEELVRRADRVIE